MEKILITNRLQLIQMAEKDAPALYNIWSDPDVTKHMNITPFTEVEQAKEMIHYLHQLAENNSAIRYTIFELQSNNIVGSCGYNLIDWENDKAEIGYDIAKAYWGKGYAPEAISALLTYAFDTLKLNRIEAKVEPENINSSKVLRKLNFTLEGTLRKAEKSKGTYVDLQLFSKLKTD